MSNPIRDRVLAAIEQRFPPIKTMHPGVNAGDLRREAIVSEIEDAINALPDSAWGLPPFSVVVEVPEPSKKMWSRGECDESCPVNRPVIIGSEPSGNDCGAELDAARKNCSQPMFPGPGCPRYKEAK